MSESNPDENKACIRIIPRWKISLCQNPTPMGKRRMSESNRDGENTYARTVPRLEEACVRIVPRWEKGVKYKSVFFC